VNGWMDREGLTLESSFLLALIWIEFSVGSETWRVVTTGY
jgi:hypothetical protein